MKKLILLLALFGIVPVLSAQEAAELLIKVGKEKQLQRVVFALDEASAPETVANFKKLAKKGFYKGTAFHRVFPKTLVQVGDPYSKNKDRVKVGTGGPGYTLAPEIRAKHVKGAVAMARLGDNVNPSRRSNGSQFYVTLKPMPELDGQYTVFGRVLEGLEVLEAISQKPADSNDNPVERIEIRKVRIVPQTEIAAGT